MLPGKGGCQALRLLDQRLGQRSDNTPDCPHRLKGPFSFLKHLDYCQGRAYEASKPDSLCHYPLRGTASLDSQFTEQDTDLMISGVTPNGVMLVVAWPMSSAAGYQLCKNTQNGMVIYVQAFLCGSSW